ncbi:hypothetical protein I3843_15G050900 [Carya illinoinensis]|nr:hypothetical protein I3843_15G050900 [Carya illinoinensis]
MEQLRYKSCACPHSLVFVGQRFLASSQLREPYLLLWLRSLPVLVQAFQRKRVSLSLLTVKGHTFLVAIYREIASGRQLRKWHARYRSVTCLVFSDDDSLLIYGLEEGSVRVLSLYIHFSFFSCSLLVPIILVEFLYCVEACLMLQDIQ